MFTKQGRGVRRIVRTQPLNKTPIDHGIPGYRAGEYGPYLRGQLIEMGIIKPAPPALKPNNNVEEMNRMVQQAREMSRKAIEEKYAHIT